MSRMSIDPNPTQYTAWTDGTLPAVEEVQEGVWAVPLPMEEGGYVRYTLTYLVSDTEGGVHVIDPGWGLADNVELLERGFQIAGFSFDQVRSIVSSHLHPDHTGLAGMIRTRSGAPLLVHSIEREAMESGFASSLMIDMIKKLRTWGMPRRERRRLFRDLWRQRANRALLNVTADGVLEDGDLLNIPGRTIRVIHTPGHTEGSICLHDEGARTVFTGDTLLPMIFPGIGLGVAASGSPNVNPLARYFASLDRLAVLDVDRVHPGHGYSFAGLAARCAETVAHHEKRSEEVRLIIGRNPRASVWQVAEQINWTAGWDALTGYMRISALSQTAMHLGYLEERAA